MMRLFGWFIAVITFCATWSFAYAVEGIPACRLDGNQNRIVIDTLRRAIGAFSALGKPLGIEDVDVNPTSASKDPKTLSVYVITDAAENIIDASQCSTAPLSPGDSLDPLSVRGGCVVVAIERKEMRCSAAAVKIFSNVGQRSGVANPTLLYVMSHELAHLYQRRVGEYAGRVERINLDADQTTKLKVLREACDPVSTKLEEEADAISLQVLRRLLPGLPYREPVFSERGSLFWNIDLLALATDAWRKMALEREFMSEPALHASFNPTEFPTPSAKIRRNAERFVCDVLTKRRGTVLYPGKSVTHPPLEIRLQRIAEALSSDAKSLPTTNGAQDFAPVARLQGGLSPIFTHIYRETGVYLDALQSQICTAVNGTNPLASCR